jgi:hypothetical protein
VEWAVGEEQWQRVQAQLTHEVKIWSVTCQQGYEVVGEATVLKVIAAARHLQNLFLQLLFYYLLLFEQLVS